MNLALTTRAVPGDPGKSSCRCATPKAELSGATLRIAWE